MESVVKVKGLDLSEDTWSRHVAAQGNTKNVRNFVKKIEPKKTGVDGNDTEAFFRLISGMG